MPPNPRRSRWAPDHQPSTRRAIRLGWFVVVFATIGVIVAPSFAAAAPAGPAAPAAPAGRPNVVVILADDLGYSDLGCYGSEIETPNLDALARGGVRFTQFYNTARCWPSRAALMTGYYPQQVGMDPPAGRFPTWTRTLPQLLKPAGYRSYHSGKWHVQNAPRVVADGGFDRSYHLQDHDRNFGPRRHEEDDRKLPPVQPGANYYTTVAIADHAVRCLKEHAERHAGEPFFSYVAFTVPHFPIQAPAEDIARYRERYKVGWDALRAARLGRMTKMGLVTGGLPAPEPQVVAPSGKPADAERVGPGELRHAAAWDSLTAEQKALQATKLAVHAAMVDRMDREIGRVLDQLRAMNALGNTAVFFLADNGASAELMIRGDGHDPAADPGSAGSYLCLGPGGSTVANAPFRRHKIWVHEGGIATPLIVHWPKGITARGELRHDPGHCVDLVPTVLDMAGGPVSVDSSASAAPSTKPAIKAPPFPGRSLVPAFAKDGTIDRGELFFHHQGNRAIRVGDWKLVSAVTDGNRWELYDLKVDRAESNDLAAAHPDRVKAMSARWEALQAEFVRQAEEGTPADPATIRPGAATRPGGGRNRRPAAEPPAAQKLEDAK